jgi:hypothetical protein
MATGIRLGQWPEKPPRAHQLIAVIRSLVEHADIVLVDHAEERMVARDIDMIDVLRVLKTGEIVGPIEPGVSEQEWKCKVTASPRYPENNRETVEWEDER